MGPRGARPFYRIRSALGEPRSALGAHAYKHRHRMIGGRSPVVLGVPFGPGSAHVIKFGPVRVEETPGQVLHKLGDIGQDARLLAVAGVASSYLFHDLLRRAFRRLPVRPVHIAQGASLIVIVRVNLLKTSRNLPVISDSWASVAKKRLLGLRIDAIRSHFTPRGVPMAGDGAERACRGLLRAANQHRRREG